MYDAADITHLRLREVSKQWGANVIRLPINQEWALDGVMDSKTGTLVQSAADYLSDIDCVVGWAATEHMYLLLSLQTLKPGYNAPMPDNRSIVLWRLLASRFRREPGVLFDLLNEPHQPSPHDRYPYVGPKPQTDSGWVDLWHEWVRVLEAVIHDVHPDALIFVSGIGGPAWASDLSSFPVVPRTPVGTSSLPNAVYSAHFYPHGALRSGGARLFDRLLGYTDAAGKARPLPLPANHPVFLGEFGPKESVDDVIDVTQSPPQPVPTWTAEQRWLCSLLRYIRALHAPHYRGLVGWTAWSWADAPRLVRRLGGKRGTGGCAQDNPFMADSSGNRVPTSFGQIVKEELAQKGGAMGPTCR